ncbi:hypothetical protein PIB30_097209, partial [Stylosanthes scabra]|nr:hypothetical protein [Stylosanthes scabra]
KHRSQALSLSLSQFTPSHRCAPSTALLGVAAPSRCPPLFSRGVVLSLLSVFLSTAPPSTKCRATVAFLLLSLSPSSNVVRPNASQQRLRPSNVVAAPCHCHSAVPETTSSSAVQIFWL